ncbi:hypothetical protein HY493_02205 [Candidatus Woesearchaeota archaeon]|nr:hypothetical protein [Candidatus Woesearchaeota archaeon]
MRRAATIGMVVFWIVALAAMVLFIWIVASKTLETGTTGITFGCSPGKVTKECPCNGIRVISGYCCENGPSEKPCFCGDENINKCTDYTTEARCNAQECTPKSCYWGVDGCYG